MLGLDPTQIWPNVIAEFLVLGVLFVLAICLAVFNIKIKEAIVDSIQGALSAMRNPGNSSASIFAWVRNGVGGGQGIALHFSFWAPVLLIIWLAYWTFAVAGNAGLKRDVPLLGLGDYYLSADVLALPSASLPPLPDAYRVLERRQRVRLVQAENSEGLCGVVRLPGLSRKPFMADVSAPLLTPCSCLTENDPLTLIPLAEVRDARRRDGRVWAAPPLARVPGQWPKGGVAIGYVKIAPRLWMEVVSGCQVVYLEMTVARPTIADKTKPDDDDTARQPGLIEGELTLNESGFWINGRNVELFGVTPTDEGRAKVQDLLAGLNLEVKRRGSKIVCEMAPDSEMYKCRANGDWYINQTIQKEFIGAISSVGKENEGPQSLEKP